MSKIEELRDWGLSLYFLAHNNSFTFNWNGTKFKLFVSTYCEYNRGKEGAKREPKTNKWIDGLTLASIVYMQQKESDAKFLRLNHCITTFQLLTRT